MQKLDPQILTPMLEFVHASKIHVFEFNNSIFAFAGVETTFYTRGLYFDPPKNMRVR